MENKIELGSEFNLSLNELHIVKNNLFTYLKDYKVQWFDYGRSALRHIPIPKGRIVLLPEFICESVIKCFCKNSIRFYCINEMFQIDIYDLLEKIDETVGVIYVAHYFGFLQSESILSMIREIANKRGILVIEDTTQSLFSAHKLFGDYMLASIRKWMAVPMGGILYTKQAVLPELSTCRQNNDNTKAYGMILKEIFLKMSYDTNVAYREIFSEAEELVDSSADVGRISDFAYFLIKCVDIENLIERRKRNSARLSEGLKELGIDSIRLFDKSECPLVYPIRVKNRDDFRRYLMENRVYSAVHWPFDGILPEERINAKKNAETLLSLPIDQRYGEKEIDYMINVICRYGGELSF